MSNNLFYKALAAVSTAGIVAIAGIQATTALKKGNNADDQLAKTMVEIKKARKDALAEVKSFRSDVLRELKEDRKDSLVELKSAKQEAVQSIRFSAGSKTGRVWLILTFIDPPAWNEAKSAGIEKVPMSSMDECLKAAKKFSNYKVAKGSREKYRTACMSGDDVRFVVRDKAEIKEENQ